VNQQRHKYADNGKQSQENFQVRNEALLLAALPGRPRQDKKAGVLSDVFVTNARNHPGRPHAPAVPLSPGGMTQRLDLVVSHEPELASGHPTTSSAGLERDFWRGGLLSLLA
jgi:hypothetical protein